MAGSVTLIVIGILVLAGGDWPVGLPIVCIAAGAAWWHVSDYRERVRRADSAGVSGRVVSVRKALAVTAATTQVAAVLIIGGAAFDHPEQGLFSGFDSGALLLAALGAGMLVAAAQLDALKRRVDDQMLASLLRMSRLSRAP